jgi:hypothetical protein
MTDCEGGSLGALMLLVVTEVIEEVGLLRKSECRIQNLELICGGLAGVLARKLGLTLKRC